MKGCLSTATERPLELVESAPVQLLTNSMDYGLVKIATEVIGYRIPDAFRPFTEFTVRYGTNHHIPLDLYFFSATTGGPVIQAITTPLSKIDAVLLPSQSVLSFFAAMDRWWHR